jgi:hypothetical protein
MDNNNALLRSQIFQYGGYPIPINIYNDEAKLKTYLQLFKNIDKRNVNNFKKDGKPPKKISPKKTVVKKAPIKKIKIENNSKQGVIVIKQTKEKGNNIKITIDNRKQVKTRAIGAKAPQKTTTSNNIFSPYQTLGGIINNYSLQEKLKDKNEIIQTQRQY